MARQLTRWLLIATVWVAWPSLTAADPLDGMYTIAFTGPLSIWSIEDLDGCETFTEPGVSIEVCSDLNMLRDAKGKIFGAGSIVIDATVDGIDFDGTLVGSVKGRVKGTSGKPAKAKLSFKFEGPVTVLGFGVLDGKVSGKFKGEISETGVMTGTLTQKVCVKKVGCEKASVALVDNAAGGSWTLQLMVTHVDGKLTGTGTATLPGGIVRTLVAKGKHRDTKGSSLSLKGEGVDKGAKVKLKNVQSSGPGVIDSGEAKYKMDGFKAKPLL